MWVVCECRKKGSNGEWKQWGFNVGCVREIEISHGFSSDKYEFRNLEGGGERTWDELYDAAIDTACGDWRLRRKDNAREEVRELTMRLGYADLEIAECPEDEVDYFCKNLDIRFDDNGFITRWKAGDTVIYEHTECMTSEEKKAYNDFVKLINGGNGNESD